MKKMLALLLATFMILTSFVACNTPTPSQDSQSTPAGGAEQTPSPEATPAETEGHGIPNDLKYNGKTITIACWESPQPEFDVDFEDCDGDPVVDAVYKRNLYTEQLLDVELDFIPFYTDEGKTGIESYANSLKNAVSDASTFYDIVATYSRSTAQCFVNGLIVPLDVYNVLDLSKEWWPKNIQEEFSMDNNLFFISGDISTNMLNYMYGVFYNIELADQYGRTNLPDLVKNNEWTLDKMVELSSGLYDDLDTASGKSSGDFYGMTLRYHMADALIQGSNFKLAENSDEDGVVVKVSDDFTSELFDTFISDMIEYTSSDDVYNEVPDGSGTDGWSDTAALIFLDSRAMFAINRMKFGFELQETDITYGILPMPKRNPADDFNTCVDNSYTLYGICRDTADGDAAAAVIQALGYYGLEFTTPALFEVTFKGKFSKEEVFLDMFDCIKEHVGFDIGRLFTVHMDLIADKPTNLAIAKKTEWSLVMTARSTQLLNRIVSNFNETIYEIINATS